MAKDTGPTSHTRFIVNCLMECRGPTGSPPTCWRSATREKEKGRKGNGLVDRCYMGPAYSGSVRVAPPGKLVDVGGFSLHIHCAGEGSPSIVLDAALGASSVSWCLVQPELAKLSRVCTYDRAGFGWSDGGPMLRTAGRIADELRTLLDRAGVPPPFLPVGHSFGGLVALIFAHRFRSEMVGMVLVDPA